MDPALLKTYSFSFTTEYPAMHKKTKLDIATKMPEKDLFAVSL
jgi:hypothetical protein